MPETNHKTNRREFVRRCLGGLTGMVVAGAGVAAARRKSPRDFVWQIDSNKCVYCGKCATECVLSLSAVKCVHAYAMCGYCNLCFGYFLPEAPGLDTGGENQMCPTGAIKRTFIEDPYFRYTIEEERCVGCAKCVKGCNTFGNGSLYLQVRHDRCLNCQECAIARVCPGDAFRRVPNSKPYLRRDLPETDEIVAARCPPPRTSSS